MAMPDEMFRQKMRDFSTNTGKTISDFHEIFNVLCERILQLEADNALADNEVADLKERIEKLEKLTNLEE